MKNFTNGYTTIVVIVGTLTIIGVAIWGYIKYNAPQESVVEQPTTSSLTQDSWKTYSDSQHRYSFKYPSDFMIDQSSSIINSGVAFKFPARYMVGTNLSKDSYIHVDVKDNVLDCSAETFTENRGYTYNNLEPITVNGIVFTGVYSEDGGAGNRYAQTFYTTAQNAKCYGIILSTRSSVVELYDPPVKSFDSVGLSTIYRGMISSFSFK